MRKHTIHITSAASLVPVADPGALVPGGHSKASPHEPSLPGHAKPTGHGSIRAALCRLMPGTHGLHWRAVIGKVVVHQENKSCVCVSVCVCVCVCVRVRVRVCVRREVDDVVLLAFVPENEALFSCCDIALTSVCPLSS